VITGNQKSSAEVKIRTYGVYCVKQKTVVTTICEREEGGGRLNQRLCLVHNNTRWK